MFCIDQPTHSSPKNISFHKKRASKCCALDNISKKFKQIWQRGKRRESRKKRHKIIMIVEKNIETQNHVFNYSIDFPETCVTVTKQTKLMECVTGITIYERDITL